MFQWSLQQYYVSVPNMTMFCFFVQVILITTPTIMYLGFAMHKIARMEDTEYRPVRNQKKRMPIVSRGAVRDYEEAEDNGEEDPMIAEEIEQDKTDKAEKSEMEIWAALRQSQSSFGSFSYLLPPFDAH